MNKPKILVFTNLDKWDNMSKEVKNRIKNTDDWETDYPKVDGPAISKVKFINNQAQLSSVDLNSIAGQDGIFLVYDQITRSDFNILQNQCLDDTSLFILAHTNGNYPKASFSSWKYNGIKEGSHIPQPGNVYLTFFDILTDSEVDKEDRIINQVFRPLLDAALGLLDQCNADSNFDPTTSLLAKSFPKNSDAEKAITTYSESGRDLRDLEALRDELLKYALEQN